MTNYNLKTLDGVFTYAVVSGFFLSVWIHTGMDVSETGLAITFLKTVTNVLGSPSPYLIPAVSIGVTIGEGLVIFYYVRQIAEHGISGVIVSGTGFFGALAVILGSFANMQFIIYLGIVLWIIGILAARLSDG
jgi:hypothetical protein